MKGRGVYKKARLRIETKEGVFVDVSLHELLSMCRFNYPWREKDGQYMEWSVGPADSLTRIRVDFPKLPGCGQ